MPVPKSQTITVCHSIRGRLRVKTRWVYGSEQRAALLLRMFSGKEGIQTVDIRPLTGSVIFVYDPSRLHPDFLVASLVQEVEHQAHATVVSESPTLPRPKKRLTRSPHQVPGSLWGRAFQVLVLSGLLAYSLIRQFILKNPLSQRPLSAAGLLAAGGSIPLLWNGVREMRQGKLVSLPLFLGATCVVAVIAGEALTALEVLWIHGLGTLLEEYVADRSRRAIRQTLLKVAKNTFVLVDSQEVEVPVDRVREGDIVVVRTGERIPVDGRICGGEALVDEAHITGRSDPELRKEPDPVFAGTLVQQGMLHLRAEQVGEATYIAHILHLVEESLANRAPVERRAETLAARLLWLGGAITAGTFLVTGSLARTLNALLIMACPCATVLAASTAVTAALANAARNHILVKGGLYLESVGKAEAFCFDKTGTITTEVPHIVEVVPRANWISREQLLSLAAIAEMHNPHPLAQALLKASALTEGRERGADASTVTEIILGKGVRATVGEDTVVVGNAQLMQEEGIDVNYFKIKARTHLASGNTVLYVGKNGKVQGIIAASNTIRADAEAVMTWLRNDGVANIYLVTGDAKAVAKHLADKMGLDGYQAELLPENKARYVSDLEAGGQRVVMVGDGANDALAFARSTAGIAMGAGGAEAAIEAADIALADSDLKRLVTLRQLSRQMMRVIEQNHWFAVSTDVFGCGLAAAGQLPPLAAGLLHIAHTLGIMLNSTRLLEWEAPGFQDRANAIAHSQEQRKPATKPSSSKGL